MRRHYHESRNKKKGLSLRNLWKMFQMRETWSDNDIRTACQGTEGKMETGMIWRGDILKRLVKCAQYSQEEFAKEIGVSRRTFFSWTKSQVPKGIYLLRICRLLDISPDKLFEHDKKAIRLPVYKKT
jgi:DNA-binding XRE family transcriptional regulator